MSMTPRIRQLTNTENKTRLSNLGAFVSVRGSVVDIRFDAHLLPIYSFIQPKSESNPEPKPEPEQKAG